MKTEKLHRLELVPATDPAGAGLTPDVMVKATYKCGHYSMFSVAASVPADVVCLRCEYPAVQPT